MKPMQLFAILACSNAVAGWYMISIGFFVAFVVSMIFGSDKE